MGEKEGNRGEEKQNKPESGPTTVVLKVDLHCEGCAQKVKRSIKRVDGVDSVSTDMASNKLTVVGKLDPVKLRERLEQKTKKKVEIVSPAVAKPKDGGGDSKKPAATAGDGGIGGVKEVKMPAEEKAKSPQTSNALSKIRLIQMIRKKIYEVKGVEGKRKESGDGRGGKKEGDDGEKKKEGGVGEKQKEGGGSGKDKKERGGDKMKEGGEGGDEVKEGGKAVRVKTMEYYGASYGHQVEIAPTPYTYRNDRAPISTEYRYGMTPTSSEYQYEMAPVSSEYRHEAAPMSSSYQIEKGPAPYWYGSEMSHAPQIFSDENPNACLIM